MQAPKTLNEAHKTGRVNAKTKYPTQQNELENEASKTGKMNSKTKHKRTWKRSIQSRNNELENKLQITQNSKMKHDLVKNEARARFSKLPITFRASNYFFELIYLSANGNYWRKLSDMLHESIKIKI